MSRMEERKRREFLKAEPPPAAGAIVLGQAPTPQQQMAMAKAQVDMHLVAVTQNIFNQVAAHMLSTQDQHQQLTHEKMTWLAEQCQCVAPYVLHAFGVFEMNVRLPSEATTDEQLPTKESASK
jgi:hypothetical protein